MNSSNQNYDHSKPRQKRDRFRPAAQTAITAPTYRVTIEHGSIECPPGRWTA